MPTEQKKVSYDIFNGDADGICALIQLRLAQPNTDAQLITGVKRDISLVQQVPLGQPADLTVLDISLDKNRKAIDQQLLIGSKVRYFDHHYAGDSLPDSPNFSSHIDTTHNVCTSILVNQYINGQFKNWAITAAYGDNFNQVADNMANQAGLSQQQADQLKHLGILLNYNSYGESQADLHIKPADLFRQLKGFEDPLAMINQHPVWAQLDTGYKEDFILAASAEQLISDNQLHIIRLPDVAWARRVSGVLGNDLCNQYPDKAIAILTEKNQGSLTVSIRAPLNQRDGADKIARQFPDGGGRKAAAGINNLPEQELNRLVQLMRQTWPV